MYEKKKREGRVILIILLTENLLNYTHRHVDWGGLLPVADIYIYICTRCVRLAVNYFSKGGGWA